MPNAGAGAGNLPGYSDLADRQTRRRPGPSPSMAPPYPIPDRAGASLARRRALVRGNAHMAYRGR